MNKIINKFLLNGDSFIPELHKRFIAELHSNSQDLCIVLADHLLNSSKNLKEKHLI